MLVKEPKMVDMVVDVRCDVCGDSTVMAEGYSPQYGSLSASWGYGSRHDGQRYEVHLCEDCFFTTLSYFRENRRVNTMFELGGFPSPDFGLVDPGDELI